MWLVIQPSWVLDLSICFDVIFIVQHYVLYRNPPPMAVMSSSMPLPWNNNDGGGGGDIDTTRSDHGTPLLAGIHSLL